MDGFQKYDIPQDVLLYTKFENLLWDCTEDSINQAKEMIKYFNHKIIYKLVYTIAVHRPFSFKLLGDFLSSLDRISSKFPSFHLFSKYLVARGILTNENFHNSSITSDELLSSEEYENPLTEETNQIAFYAMKNDVHNLSEKQATDSLDFNRLFFEIQEIPFSLIDLAVYCGSIDVLKYLIINHVSFTPDTILYAVKGGNETVIEFLVSQGQRFDSQIELAIMSHHNSIAKWIMENYENAEMDLPSCIGYFNTEMLLFFVYVMQRSFKEREAYQKKFLLFGKEHDNDILLEYFKSQYK